LLAPLIYSVLILVDHLFLFLFGSKSQDQIYVRETWTFTRKYSCILSNIVGV